jgi:hypothetical protein
MEGTKIKQDAFDVIKGFVLTHFIVTTDNQDPQLKRKKKNKLSSI